MAKTKKQTHEAKSAPVPSPVAELPLIVLAHRTATRDATKEVRYDHRNQRLVAFGGHIYEYAGEDPARPGVRIYRDDTPVRAGGKYS